MLSFVLVVVVVAIAATLLVSKMLLENLRKLLDWITSRPSRSEVFRFGKFLRIVGIFLGKL